MSFRNRLLASAVFPAGAVFNLVTVGELEDQIATLTNEIDEIRNLDDPTDEQIVALGANAEKVANLTKRVNAMNAADALRAPQARKVPPPNEGGRVTAVPATPITDRKGGFKSFGEYAQAVHAHYAKPQDSAGATAKLLNAATTYGSEGVGADGGFAVPPEFQTTIWEKVTTQESLLTRCTPQPIAGNNITIPKDETTPWQTSGGILVYWESEAGAPTQTKPQLQLDTIRLQKLMALVPVTEELLEDAPAVEGYLQNRAPMKMVAKINTAIIRGTGVGQPQGILNSDSFISVAKENSQDAGSVWYANIAKMWGRMYAPLRGNAIWLVNQDVEQSLIQMAFDPEASSKVPVFLPQTGASASPYTMLMNRPMVAVESCSTLGTQGDIIFVDLSQYMLLRKAGQDIRTDVSMHLFFDQALLAYRFIFRLNGKPMWGSAITRENGSNTLSWAVTLDARS